MHEGEEFQSTPPVKAATRPALATLPQAIFQSTPPVKAATLYAWNQYDYVEISIHAAREGGDTQSFFAKLAHAYFNPRRP